MLSSCEDALDIIQDGELNDQALFTSVDNMQLVLNEVYDQMTVVNEQIVGSQLTDEVALGDAGFPGNTHSFQIFSTNGFAENIWSQKYLVIDRANRLIRGSEFFTPIDEDLPRYNNILAQARAIRAFAHFQLLVYFSTDITNDSALGVMLSDQVQNIDTDLPRSTVGEVFTFIEEDLAFASTNLTNPTTGEGSYNFFNTNIIDAMRARMYLYRENYELAEQFADNIINNSGINLAQSTGNLPNNFPQSTSETAQIGAEGQSSFDTAPPETSPIQLALFEMDRSAAGTPIAPDYRLMWIDAIQGEIIFSMPRPNNANNYGSIYNTNQSYTGGAPLWDMGRNLYTLYTQPLGNGAQDFRRWCFVDRSATISPNPTEATRTSEVIVIDKYPGKAGSHNSNDVKIFRMSEMYFIKAECRVEAGDLISAANLIQEVRQARNYINGAIVPTPSYANSTEAYADILLERNKELCFEGHRYIDLKRIGLDAGVNETNRFITDSENSSATSPFNISVNDFRFTLPIPQDEINVNDNMVQNPGETYQ
ncbi:RagB/SusD family nutrient uptake outer membrane protein [Aquimarina sp. ERC-38]|uniref:RagB/SusD family nutrient uptake outer membrane protein n=1 Tax=Aquimarina sp. ERC-38 TaxID=2949996 RepID=UPI00224756AA|nr:RagB/SusD family nutrient uptake outer membrane protein [Aquimarina sp. ERC-38]UZO80959.1 RagB/SusD family nutrient uptake outer membrane protein [Aquimarina sp. ERC-38]